MSTSTDELTIQDPIQRAARVYLEDRAYEVLLGRPEPAKTGEMLRELGLEDVTLRTVRYVLGSSPRFEAMERRWTLASRIQDTKKPFERVVETLISAYGKPIKLLDLAQELALTYDRPQDYYESMIPKLLRSLDKFFAVDSEHYGLSNWLVTVESDDPEDVLFDNFMEKADIEPYNKVASKIKWNAEDVAASAAEFVNKFGKPVPMKAIAFYAWEALGSQYDPVGFYGELALSDKVELLSTQELISASMKNEVIKAISTLAAEIEEMPVEAEEEAAETGPVAITESDRDEVVSLIIKQGGTVSAEEILESVLEISPDERGYDVALDSLKSELESEDRVVRVGPDRWRPAGSIPEYVQEIPSVLIIPPVMPFETPEGDIFDQELEDEGLDAGLRNEILNPLVQDIGDEDPDETAYQPLDTYQRCALKYHHKEAGTMPLIQFHPDFFPREPEIVHITLTSEGVRRDAWINNRTRLIYGLKDWFTSEMPVSGAAFEIHKTERPGEYRFVYDNRTDPLVFVPTSRLLELLDLKNEADTTEMPVFDIITRILEHYRKGIGFVPLFTEVNLVRRVTRRLVASILSSYHAFHTRGKTGEWQYDPKKRSQGFNKAKRKYIKK
ncbi:MAG TPA: hypothetical protein PLU88_04195 [Armatimonadota bacterium]|nr:hypothetical protein [Armatimonadota bacterium]HOM72062.1 hypothetical protein [Armatimonadota bacterium]HPP74311.1 hypothetical protein [Armatimonadota bacterium]